MRHMKTMSLRSLAREAPTLEEAVIVTHDGQIIGRFIPTGVEETEPARFITRDPGFNTRPFTPVPKKGK